MRIFELNRSDFINGLLFNTLSPEPYREHDGHSICAQQHRRPSDCAFAFVCWNAGVTATRETMTNAPSAQPSGVLRRRMLGVRCASVAQHCVASAHSLNPSRRANTLSVRHRSHDEVRAAPSTRCFGPLQSRQVRERQYKPLLTLRGGARCIGGSVPGASRRAWRYRYLAGAGGRRPPA